MVFSLRSLAIQVLGLTAAGEVGTGDGRHRRPGPLARRQADVPARDSFIRRAFVQAAVLGNYLYIDSGEVSQYRNSTRLDRSHGVNSTLSIDLSSSWSAASVGIKSITKPAPILNLEALWTDPTTRSFYIWGGQASHTAPAAKAALWRFTADDNGGGTWTTKLPANPSVFDSLVRTWNSAFTTGAGAGFAIGGTATPWTDPSVSLTGTTQAVPGAVSYNFSTGAWRNDTTAPLTASGTYIGGRAEFIPGFGEDGFIAFLGGLTSALEPFTSLHDPRSAGYLDFGNITLYDPVSGQWYWQMASGTMPTPRRHACTVSAASPNGTHEIFLFGGTNNVYNSTYDDVFVLSLPGFVWHQLSSSGAPRSHHACAVAGRRQMISVGGYQDHFAAEGGWMDRDPWPQGIGVFDMTTSTWKTEFDATAAAYDSPQPVQEWYQKGGQFTVSWSSDAVKQLFQPSTPATSSPAIESQRLGTIVGGVVAGAAVVVIGLIAASLICRQRRRRRSYPRVTRPRTDSLESVHPGARASLKLMQPPIGELGTGSEVERPLELYSAWQYSSSQLRLELEGSGVAHEMWSPDGTPTIPALPSPTFNGAPRLPPIKRVSFAISPLSPRGSVTGDAK